jgi:hypothetical protein
MSAHHMPGMSRRRFLNAAAAGLGAASAAGLTASCTGAADTGRGTPAGRGFADAVLEAFQTHRLVGLGEEHGLQNHHDALAMLLSDPRLPGVADDIVVEFGNALYQATMNRFIGGQPVSDADLRPAWRNTTQSPYGTWDQPVYEQFYRTVRAVNWTRPAGRRMRVLLGDPPIDWTKITNASEFFVFLHQRDAHAASVVEKEVLGKGHRALLCYGGQHLHHWPPGATLVSLIEQRTGERTYTIGDLLPAAGDPGGLARRLSRYPRDTVIPTAATWLGTFDAGLINPMTSQVIKGGHNGGHNGKPAEPGNAPQANPVCGARLGSLIDAGLYLGQPEDLTASWPNPAIYLDPAYWKELRRRNALEGNHLNLDSYRQEQPAQFPLPKLAPSQECGKAPPAG